MSRSKDIAPSEADALEALGMLSSGSSLPQQKTPFLTPVDHTARNDKANVTAITKDSGPSALPPTADTPSGNSPHNITNRLGPTKSRIPLNEGASPPRPRRPLQPRLTSLITVVAPPGKLGVDVQYQSDTKRWAITKIYEWAPLRNELAVGDVIIKINGTEITGNNLQANLRPETRRLSIFRAPSRSSAASKGGSTAPSKMPSPESRPAEGTTRRTERNKRKKIAPVDEDGDEEEEEPPRKFPVSGGKARGAKPKETASRKSQRLVKDSSPAAGRHDPPAPSRKGMASKKRSSTTPRTSPRSESIGDDTEGGDGIPGGLTFEISDTVKRNGKSTLCRAAGCGKHSGGTAKERFCARHFNELQAARRDETEMEEEEEKEETGPLSERHVFEVPPGHPGIKVADMNGVCRVVGLLQNHIGAPPPFEERDFIVSINGSNLARMRGGQRAWKRLILASFAREFVVLRPTVEAGETVDDGEPKQIPQTRRKLSIEWQSYSPQRKLEVAILAGYDDVKVFELDRILDQNTIEDVDKESASRKARNVKRCLLRRGSSLPSPDMPTNLSDSLASYSGDLEDAPWEPFDHTRERYRKDGDLDCSGLYFGTWSYPTGLFKMGHTFDSVANRIRQLNVTPVKMSQVKFVGAGGALRTKSKMHELEDFLHFCLFADGKHSEGENFKYEHISEVDKLARYVEVYKQTGELIVALNDGTLVSLDMANGCYYDQHKAYERWVSVRYPGAVKMRALAAEREASFMRLSTKDKIVFARKRRKSMFYKNSTWLGRWAVETRRQLVEDDFPEGFPDEDKLALQESGLFRTNEEAVTAQSDNAFENNIERLRTFQSMPGKGLGALPKALSKKDEKLQPKWVTKLAKYLQMKLGNFRDPSTYQRPAPISHAQRKMMVEEFGLTCFDNPDIPDPKGDFWIRCSKCKKLDYVYESGVGFEEAEQGNGCFICWRCVNEDYKTDPAEKAD